MHIIYWQAYFFLTFLITEISSLYFTYERDEKEKKKYATHIEAN